MKMHLTLVTGKFGLMGYSKPAILVREQSDKPERLRIVVYGDTTLIDLIDKVTLMNLPAATAHHEKVSDRSFQ
jgi:hypothetical protein